MVRLCHAQSRRALGHSSSRLAAIRDRRSPGERRHDRPAQRNRLGPPLRLRDQRVERAAIDVLRSGPAARGRRRDGRAGDGRAAGPSGRHPRRGADLCPPGRRFGPSR